MCGIFFPDPSNLPILGDGESILRRQLHQKANDVGNSGYQTFMTDPQPLPLVEIKTPGYYSSLACAKPIVTSESSVNYINQGNKLLGGITNLNREEIGVMVSRYMREHNNLFE